MDELDFDINEVGTSYLSTTNIPISSVNGSGLTIDTTASLAYFDQAETISPIISPGRTYSSSNSVTTSGGAGTNLRVSTTTTPIDYGKVETLTITSSGSGYTNTNSQQINSGNGNGLILDYLASSITKSGVVDTFNQQLSGTEYTNGGSSISVNGGSGSGMLIDFTTTPYVPGITSNIVTYDDGTGYLTNSNVITSGGSGNGLTFNIQASDFNQVITLTKIDGGTNYTNGIKSTSCISCSGTGLLLDLTLTSSSTGSILIYNIMGAGTGYSVGDIISVNGGDGDARYQVSSVNTEYPVTDLATIDRGKNYSEQTYSTSCNQCSGSGLKLDVTLVSIIDGKILIYDIDEGGSGYDIGDRVTHMLKVAKQHIDNNNYGYAKECIETIIEEITNE